MNLGTHIFFAGMVTAIFTGNPYFTLLAGIGSFIPDLDRTPLFISPHSFRKEQLHRALFHNLFFLSGLFIANVWLAVGAFLHSFLDSFTTEKDRGVEWLFPFSRLVKRGRFALTAKSVENNCTIELVDQKPVDRVCFANEDSPEMTKHSDTDLVEIRPVPWRRTYGPASNNQILDKWLAIGSFSLLIAYSLINYDFGSDGVALLFSNRMIEPLSLLAGIVLIYAGGWLKKSRQSRKGYLTVLAGGGIFVLLSIALSIDEISNYAPPLNPIFLAVASVLLTVEAVLIWRISIRGGRKAQV